MISQKNDLSNRRILLLLAGYLHIFTGFLWPNLYQMADVLQYNKLVLDILQVFLYTYGINISD